MCRKVISLVNKVWIVCLFFILSTFFAEGGLNSEANIGKLINPSSDIEYLGAFRLPDERSGGTKWNGGGSGMTYYPDGDPGGAADGYPGSLFSVGNRGQSLVSEFSIPAPFISIDKKVEELSVAATLQGFADVTHGLQNPGLTTPKLSDIQYLPKQVGQE